MALGARLDELFQSSFNHLLKKLSCSSRREKHLRAIGVRPLVGCFFALRVHGWGPPFLGWGPPSKDTGRFLFEHLEMPLDGHLHVRVSSWSRPFPTLYGRHPQSCRVCYTQRSEDLEDDRKLTA